MTNTTATAQAIEAAFEAGKASALAQLASGKPVLIIGEKGLNDLDLANARGWNSVFDKPENGELLMAASKAKTTITKPVQSLGPLPTQYSTEE